MENKEQDRPPQVPAEATDKHINYFAEEDAGTDADTDESVESHRRKHDADSGNNGPSDEMLQKEMTIDPGNEHHHRTDADDEIFDEDIDRSPKYDADAGSV